MLEGCTPYPPELVERYLRQGYWKRQTLGALLRENAGQFDGRRAISDSARVLTYRDLDLLSTRLALHLVATGLQPRDIVLMQLPNCWEFYAVFFALMKLGALPVMCLPPHRNAELGYFARLTGARAYFAAREFRGFDYLRMARELQQEAPALQHIFLAGHDPGRGEAGVHDLAALFDAPIERRYADRYLDRFDPDPLDVAFFLLSGGTTGVPKLIPRTHADYIYNATAAGRLLGWDSSTVIVVAIPAAHNFPLGCPGMVAAIALGGAVSVSLTADPAAIYEAVARDRGTFIGLSPAVLIGLLNAYDPARCDIRSLRFVCVGGQKMQPELVDRARAVWPGIQLGHAFGMAEGLLNLTRPDDPPEVIRETQGRPISPADEFRIVDEQLRDVPPGEVGELIARGPYTIRGYYRAEEHNRDAFTRDGFYRTGDMVRLHPSGNLVVEGRRKDLINRGGEKISAEEVENLILADERVHMAAVVAMPDPVLGEKACAFVVLKAGASLTLDELTRFLLQKKIAKFKLPERLEIVPSLPLTSVGKVSKKDLREMIARRLQQEAVSGSERL